MAKRIRMNDEQPKRGFRVADRRRFDSDGNMREESPAESVPTPEPAREEPVKRGSAPGGASGESRQKREQHPTDITFSSFVISLATQALMQLGELQPPDGVPLAVDRDGAKQTIDILSMIASKTGGNLDDQEQRLMDEVLHNLRVAFLRHG